MSGSPSFTPTTKTKVIEVANVVRNRDGRGGYGKDLIDNIRANCRIYIEYCSDDSREESLVINKDGSATIYLPHDSSPARDRFTIAHELGHYFLHRQNDENNCSFTRRGSDRKEWEANWFAAELLMPKDAFLQAAREDASEDNLARKFGVSRAAAKIRLQSLQK